MTKTSLMHPSDVLGFSRLAIGATAGLVDVVEAIQINIARSPGILGNPLQGRTRGAASRPDGECLSPCWQR